MVKILGCVHHVCVTSNRITVCWDIDGTKQTVHTAKISIEDRDMPKQVWQLDEQSASTTKMGEFVNDLVMNKRDGVDKENEHVQEESESEKVRVGRKVRTRSMRD